MSVEPRGNSSQSVTGYLDKVMDLQLSLPPPVRYEIIEFARHRLKDVKQPLPKLEKAFDKLAPHLPLNARQCEKFLKEAVQTELLFLQNYGEKEKNFEALFFMTLGETCCPGFRGYLADSVDKWRHLADKKSRAYLGGSNEKTRETEYFKEFFEGLCRNLHLDANPATRSLIEGVLEAIVDQFGFYYLLVCEHPEDPQWVLSGYLVPRALLFKQREAILEKWLSVDEDRRFNELLKDKDLIAEEDFPSNPVWAISQTIEGNIAEAVRRLALVARNRTIEDEFLAEGLQIVQWLNKYAEYFDAGRGRLNQFDCDVIDVESDNRGETYPAIIKWMEDLVKALPLPTESHGWLSELRASRIKAFQQIMLCLSPVNISIVTTRYISPKTYLLGEDFDDCGKAELREIANHGREHLAAQFLEQFPRCNWEEICAWVDRENREHAFVVLQPDRWVPFSAEVPAMEFMNKLSPLAGDEQVLLRNLFEVTARCFLRPLGESASTQGDLGLRVRELVCGDNNPRVPYVRAFWTRALQLLDEDRKQTLYELRGEVFKQASSEGCETTSQHLSIETIESAFPLEG